ncbi:MULTISPECIES: hypothetical protein [Methylomonas]|uniref:Uncharacterized protein n=1 Tax=Methylomonas koyamae TaxID=702114 RepID=A0A177PBE1_9GAMM|nr:hypothetical protein [Methylomonas koyamae]OAI26783.1 hypothetical protein A1355_18595 [Methylomonas koyamae]
MEDLTNRYLASCSPYISSLVYDIGNRTLVLECVPDPNSLKPHTKVIFTGIRSYSEETIDDEYDDMCMDGVVGMHWVREHIFCLRTDKKEIILELENEPRLEFIA